MIKRIAVVLVLAVIAGCGPSERPKLNIKRQPKFEPLKVPPAKEIYKDPAMETGTAIVEIGAFRGSCDLRFSGINSNDIVALASATGLRDYRLAGIGIPDTMRDAAHAQLREWLATESIGIEPEAGSSGSGGAVFLYACGAKTMVNLEMVRAGLAVVSDVPSPHADALNKASMEALSARRGVWGKSAR